MNPTQLAPIADLLDYVATPIWINHQNRIVYINAAGLAMLAAEAGQVIGKSPLDFIHPDSRGIARDRIASLTQGGARVPPIVENFLRVDGSSFEVEATAWTIPYGGSSAIQASFVDLTARKLGEERDRLAGLIADVGNALTQGNSLAEMLQMCAESIVRRLDAAFARIWTLNDRQQVLELQASAGLYTHINGPHGLVPVGKFKIGLIAQERQAHLTNDVMHDARVGDREWARREGMISFAGYPLIVDKRLVGVAALFARRVLGPDTLDSLATIANGIGLGIDRKRNEIELRASEARKAAILESALDCIISIDHESHILEFNKSAEKTFGYLRDDVIGKVLPDLIIPPALRDLHRRGMAHYLATGEGPVLGTRIEITAMRADGSEFPIELAITRIPSDGPPLFTSTLRDITAAKRAQEDLNRAKEEAEDANKAKSAFLASMSHELRTPLNAIIGYGEMLQEEVEEMGVNSLAPDLRKIHAAGKHLLGLINDVLDLSKIEAGKMLVFFEDTDVKTIIEEVVNTVHPLVGKNGNNLIVDAGPDLGQMHTDVTKVRQSLFNLLSNAAKFTTSGIITLRATAEGAEHMIFTVSDTGIGMETEQLARLFTPFQQAEAGTSRHYGGTGLGLALTRHFCRILGGDVTARSDPGKGSVFTVRLPRNSMQESGQEPAASANAEPLSSGRDRGTVLVIDDDSNARDLVKRLLSKEGFHAETAANGPQGIEKARQLKPALITLDVMMPQMDGWAVLSALKSEPELATIPVIMLTMVDNRNLGYALGAADYLMKPVDREHLASVLRKYACGTPPCPVLIIDDDTDARHRLRKLLEGEGWQVEEAADGEEGLQKLDLRKPDLILLDLMMPRMDGFEFSLRLSRSDAWCRIPVVVLTAKDLTAEERALLNGHVERVLQKGAFSMEELLEEVRRTVGACVNPNRAGKS